MAHQADCQYAIDNPMTDGEWVDGMERLNMIEQEMQADEVVSFTVNITLSRRQLDCIDRMAAEKNCSREYIIEDIIDAALAV